jgi:FAD-linked sulfhydryl oxidase
MTKDKGLTIEYKTIETRAIASPKLWGPSFWFTLHNSAAQYPLKPSDFYQEKMKNFILGLSVMVPCEKCAIHAASFISMNEDKIDEIVKTRLTLFDFFANFHNFVNERTGQEIMKIEEIRQKYMNPTKVEFITHY